MQVNNDHLKGNKILVFIPMWIGIDFTILEHFKWWQYYKYQHQLSNTSNLGDECCYYFPTWVILDK